MHGFVKLARDLWSGRGRTLTIVFAIAVGLTGFNATLGAYGILTREIERNYLESEPASATLELAGVSDELLRATAARPEILAATRRKTIHGRYQNHSGDPWQRALIFVVDDFEDMRVAKIFKERGTWPPPEGSVLVERSSLRQLEADVGGRFSLRLPSGQPRQVTIAGIAHEPALAPAQTEQAVYAYISAETARLWQETPVFDELRILVRDGHQDRQAIEAVAERLADWIAQRGLGEPHGIRVPPPLHHPHQTQMTTILALLLVFSVLVLLMSCFLAASLVQSLMARQVREIGVMKALGASTGQLAGLYGLLVQALAGTAIVLSWVPGALGARAFAASVARLLNFDILSDREPGWVIALQLGVGLLVPALALLPSAWKGCRVSVRRAFDDHGVAIERFGQRRCETWVGRAGVADVSFTYSVRNLIRLRRKLLLSLALLAAAGCAFVTALSVAKAWDTLTAQLVESRHYDIEVRFEGPVDLERIARRLAELPAVAAIEAWISIPTSLARHGRWSIETTYPDDSHGAFNLVAPPDGAKMLDADVRQGRWLTPGDRGSVVINQLVPGHDRLRLGDRLRLLVAGKPRDFAVVGKITQVGVSATAYITRDSFDASIPEAEKTGMLWVRARGGSSPSVVAQLRNDLEHELDADALPVQSVLPLSVFRNAMVAHFELLVKTLIALAALTTLVGALGLGSSIGIGVLERTREFGVLRAVGASAKQIRQLVLMEGVLVGALSIGAALASGALLAMILGRAIGQLSFKVPLPYSLSWPAIALWGVLALTVTAASALTPALRAGRTSVRESLNFV